jgi:hypothetical protein
MEGTPGQAQGETRADPFPDFPSFFGPAASEAVEVLKANARLVCSGYICAFAVARAAGNTVRTESQRGGGAWGFVRS